MSRAIHSVVPTGPIEQFVPTFVFAPLKSLKREFGLRFAKSARSMVRFEGARAHEIHLCRPQRVGVQRWACVLPISTQSKPAVMGLEPGARRPGGRGVLSISVPAYLVHGGQLLGFTVPPVTPDRG